MSPFVTVFFLLMLLINTSLFLEQEPLFAFGTKGSAVLQVPCTFVDVFVYRLNPDKSRVVSNYSTRDPSTAYFLLNISENQEYFSECWKNGLLMEKRRFHVIVCAQTEGQEKMYYLHGETAHISCQKFNSSRGETLQVFQNLKTRDLRWAGEMILDTSVSLEIIPDALRSRMKVLNEGSLIHLSKTSIMDDGFFSCLVWSDNQCQNHKKIKLYIDGQDIFLVSGESYALPCGVKGSPSEDIYWLTPSRSAGEIYEKLNATKTSNYSLVIPHLLPYHTGTYICSSQSETFNELNVFVCSILDPINITFALGDSADLMCAFNLSYFARVQWYREFNQSSEYLLVDRKGHFVKEDMKKPLNASDPNHITISELSIQDGGSYRCRVWALFDIPRGWCISRRVHLTYVTPRLDTFYFVYASLMGLMLLGMISAVVCVTIVSRNRYKREEKKERMSKAFQKSKEQLQEEKRRAEIEKKAQEKYKEWLRKKKQDEMERKLQEKNCEEKNGDYNNVNYPAPSFVNPIPWKPIHVPQQERTPRKGSACKRRPGPAKSQLTLSHTQT